jgi:hypothetical protein
MLAHNALASKFIIDQLTPLLPKDSEEVVAQVKHLYAILDVATMTDPILHQGVRRRGQEPDNYQSLCGDLASSISPPGKHDQSQGEEDLRDVIRNRDTCNKIENYRQE